MKNKYKIVGDTLIIYNRKDNREVLFDVEDFDFVSKYTWYINTRYATTRIRNIDNKQTGMYAHRLIMSFPDNFYIDHINGNKLDNRKINLRLVTNSQNQHNQLNVRGYYKSSLNRWNASIYVNRKSIYLGSYNTEAGARAAYLEAKQKYHPTAPHHLFV